MTRHYHVIENTPGYLPDSDEPPFAYTSRRAAESYAKDLADEYREHGEFVNRWRRPRFGEPFMAEVWMPQYRISGNRREGYAIEDRTRMHDLGRVIDIVECSEAQCMEEDLASGVFAALAVGHRGERRRRRRTCSLSSIQAAMRQAHSHAGSRNISKAMAGRAR